jgi:hypothetical protein
MTRLLTKHVFTEYENREFFDLKIPRVDAAAGITYMRMARCLDDLVAQFGTEAERG